MFTSRFIFDFCIFRIILIIFPILSFGLLDIDELGSIQYGIDILDKPLLFDETNSQDAILLSSKYGQKYQCTYESASSTSQKTKDAEDNAVKVGVVDLLEPMKDRSCLILTTGWWTYEFCFKKQIKQYHMEEGKIAGEVILLGHYASEFDWELTGESKKNAKEVTGRYHSQQYKNGSLCDLTGEMRSTEVKFKCQDGASDYVVGVEEPMTCAYTLTVMTDRICHHPLMKVVSLKKSLPIVCNPILNAEDYADYIESQKELLKETPLIDEENYDAESSNALEPGTAAMLDADSAPDAENAPGKDADIQKFVMDSLKSLHQVLAEGESREDKIVEESDDSSPSDFQDTLKQLIDKKLLNMKENDKIGEQPTGEHDEMAVQQKADKEENQEHVIIESKDDEIKLSTDGEVKKEETKIEETPVEPKKESSSIEFGDDVTAMEYGETEFGDTFITWQGQGNQIQQITVDSNMKVRVTQLDKSKSDEDDSEMVEENRETKEYKSMSSSERRELTKARKTPPARRVEVRVFSAAYYDKDGNEVSLAENQQNIERMVIAVLHREDEGEVTELEKHRRLEDNYEFKWTGGKKKPKTERNVKL